MQSILEMWYLSKHSSFSHNKTLIINKLQRIFGFHLWVRLIPDIYLEYCTNKMDIVEKFLPTHSGQILDVGCGNVEVVGHQYCDSRLRMKHRVIGVDLNPGKQSNVVTASAQDLPFSDQSIDYVVSFDVIEHIENYSGVVEEMLRVARERVIIIVPTTSKAYVRKIINFFRRMIGGAGSKYGQFILQGHYYEFFEEEIIRFKGDEFKVKFLRVNYPIVGKSFFNRSGIIYAGIYVFDRI